MITSERHSRILALIEEKEIVNIQELVDATQSSDSTIRRDLSQLHKEKKLKRVHGGAEVLHQKGTEPDIEQKSDINLESKQKIGQYAAEMVKDGDRIFLDAGTTTLQMIPYLAGKNIMVVTNGLTHLESLASHHIPTYLIGGYMKQTTKALIGARAISSLTEYRFDKCFMGVNGIHADSGYTTPDPEEAAVKTSAIRCSQKAYILADSSKFDEITFAKIAELHEAIIITEKLDDYLLAEYTEKTEIKVVSTP
ncbi:DeoR/GlpR transcriptional regulator [Bacillus sp. FJAT-42376]|uniref:DeoR/GlpR family DNA-binding transcription regulator n=1 Tax=Bacillus sp. FJAT-42376 TaxID=2014076 RepID=UPI000F4FE18D|nr:DeoR/GlpR family DNA-binding transcription regulator [Bacillus sp. FJAT-42376]AZB43964.1 DeoR/GlpR transcriptional regulator [Bacillus sp. FJAT-42376]